jgi:hypothetical protein
LNPATAILPRTVVGGGAWRYDVHAVGGLRWDTNDDGSVDERDEPLAWDARPGPGEVISAGAVGLVLDERVAVGFAVSVPSRTLFRVEAQDSSLPVYPLYADRLQRVELAVGGAWKNRVVALGAGLEVVPRADVSLALTVDAAASNVMGEGLPTVEDQVSVDVHEVSLDLGAGFVPIVGGTLEFGELVPALEGLALGVSYREQGGVPVDIGVDLQGDLRLVDADDATIALSAPLALFLQDHFVPRSVRAGIAWNPSWGTTFAEAWWQQWSAMDAAVVRLTGGALESPALDLSGIEVTDGNSGVGSFRDVVEIHAGYDSGASQRWHGSGGAAWAPRAVDVADGVLLDADRLELAAGLGRGPVMLHLQWHRLLARTMPAIASGAGSLVEGGRHEVGGSLWFASLVWTPNVPR